MINKPKRKQDKKLLKKIAQRPCLICGKQADDAHHVTSRGAGGDDTERNCIPLCRLHHIMFHQYGRQTMFEKYLVLVRWAHEHGRYDLID